MHSKVYKDGFCDYLGQLVVAEVQVDQRVQLAEAAQSVQLVSGQAQSLDVAQTGVSRFQDPQAVVGQIHVDQIVQVLQTQRSYLRAAVEDTPHLCRGIKLHPPGYLTFYADTLEMRRIGKDNRAAVFSVGLSRTCRFSTVDSWLWLRSRNSTFGISFCSR